MFIKLMRLGRDAEARVTQTGKNVVELSAVYDVGYGDNKKPQWVKLSLWRDNAPLQYLTKGAQIVATVKDLHIEEYQKKDGGTGAMLRGTLVEFEFAGSRQQEGQPQQQQHQSQQQYQQPRPGYNANGTQQSMQPVAQRQPTQFLDEDYNDQIPF